MTGHPYLALITTTAVLVYYFVVWFLFGRDPKPGPIVILYEPPRRLSPAMLRYAWKQALDDRTFWASALSLVSKGLAEIHDRDSVVVLQPVPHVQAPADLPDEEKDLFRALKSHTTRKPLVLSTLDATTQYDAEHLCEVLRRSSKQDLIHNNFLYVQIGCIASAIAVSVSAAPSTYELWFAILFAFGLMWPAAYYLFFVSLRLYGAARTAVIRKSPKMLFRSFALVLFALVCTASIAIGGVVIGVDFGVPALISAAALVAINLAFFHLMKKPTPSGRKLLDEIEGFRTFLESVEKLPMDRDDDPGASKGIYERYLPYAIALEVEQRWADKFVFLSSTNSEADFETKSTLYNLGMWNGRVVEIAFGRPEKYSSFR